MAQPLHYGVLECPDIRGEQGTWGAEVLKRCSSLACIGHSSVQIWIRESLFPELTMMISDALLELKLYIERMQNLRRFASIMHIKT